MLCYFFFFSCLLPTPRSTRSDTLLPYATLFRLLGGRARQPQCVDGGVQVAMLLLKNFDSTSDFGFIHRWATPIRSFGVISCPACRAICMLSKDKVALSHKAETSSKFYELVGGPVVKQQETTPWKVRI